MTKEKQQALKLMQIVTDNLLNDGYTISKDLVKKIVSESINKQIEFLNNTQNELFKI